jgi:hypothetical protein
MKAEHVNHDIASKENVTKAMSCVRLELTILGLFRLLPTLSMSGS